MGIGVLLTASCVLPPGSAGDDDDASSGDTDPGTAGDSTGTGEDPGATSAGDDSTGAPGCPEPESGGLPGIHPTAVWLPTFDYPAFPTNTLTRFDTNTMLSTGQYNTREFTDNNPVEVAVSLSGDVVVGDDSILSAQGTGLTKFYGDIDDCMDADGDGSITTSSGGGDLLAWEDEECRAWFLPLDYGRQYPPAWIPGVWNTQTCEYEGEEIWVSGMRVLDPAAATVELEVIRVDGETGVILDSAPLPDPNGGQGFVRLVSAAVDAQGNYWTFQSDMLSRVDRATMTAETWTTPIDASTPHGLTVGRSGYVFICGNVVTRFDPATETWETSSEGIVGVSACVEDGQGRLWVSGNWSDDELVALDVETLDVAQTIPLPHIATSLGIDFEDRLWAYSANSTHQDVFRIDLGTGAQDQIVMPSRAYEGRSSDLTGFVLANQLAP